MPVGREAATTYLAKARDMAEPERSTEITPFAVKILTGRPDDSAALAHMLRDSVFPCEVIPDIDALLVRIRRGCGPVVAMAEAIDHRIADLNDALNAQPNWSDLPLLLFAEPARVLPEDFTSLIERSNTTLLRLPVQPTTFLTVVRSAVTDRRRQYAVRDLLQDLERLNRYNRQRIVQLQRLTVQLSQVEERERRHLAGLLHDDLQQILTSAQYRLKLLLNRVEQGRDVWEPANDLQRLILEAMQQSRMLSHDLCPPPLRRHGLLDSLRWLADLMRRNHGLTVHVHGYLDEVVENEDLEILAYRAIQELLFNVAKHAGTDRAWVDVETADGVLAITVRDEGCGFTPPRSIEDVSKTGLGLFGIQERACILGGDLIVESEPGCGSRFLLHLPLPTASVASAVAGADTGARSGPASSDGAQAPAGDGDTTRVVIVDDHRYLREGVKALLGDEADLEVVGEAAEGRQALDLIEAVTPDVVLIDVDMPVMDGEETTRLLRQRHPALRIICLSTFSAEDMSSRMRAAGADAYYCKSDPTIDLVAAVRAAAAG